MGLDDGGKKSWLTRTRVKVQAMSKRRKIIIITAVALAILAIILVPVLVVYLRPGADDTDILSFIDPLIGTSGVGHVFPGSTLPYGMAKAVADVSNSPDDAGGYVSDNSKILGFSQLHDSGPGADGSLGNFPLFAHPGCPDDDYNQCDVNALYRPIRRDDNSVVSRPGYFKLGLENSVTTEMTSTAHTNLFRFNFPDTAEVDSDGVQVPNSPLILIDLTDLRGTRSSGTVQVDPDTGRMTGNATFQPSFGRGSYSAHYCVDFSGADIRQSGTFLGSEMNSTTYAMGEMVDGYYIPSGSAGTWIHFERPSNSRILARVGVSFLSVDKACTNAENEMPDFSFDSAMKSTEDAWREKLSVISVDEDGVDQNLVTTFWSGLYRIMLSPQDYSGENPLWNSSEPYFDSFYCIWDSFRAQHPLLILIDPTAYTRMVRALIDIYKNAGKLPDCRMSFDKGYTQGGSNADVVLADAYLKNITQGVDWELGYEAVVSDAEVQPTDWAVEGRGGLNSWHDLGYIPYDDTDSSSSNWIYSGRSVSRAIEYAYNDFAIGLMARGLGKTDDETKYLGRARNWKNFFNAEVQDQYPGSSNGSMVAASQFKGFLQPKATNGTWSYQHPRLCSPVYEPDQCYLDTKHATYEGSAWLYTFYVPQDMAALITALGGKQTFVSRLDYFHSSGLIDVSNEQAFLPTYQFHYGGRPGRSAYWLHNYIPSRFNSTLGGVPGNDDCAMGAFTAFAFMGFFPVAGQSVYLLTAPFFREISIRTPGYDTTGSRATIRNVKGFDPGEGYKNIYIQSATLNGEPYTKNWIGHDFFLNGGLLEFVLGPEESVWGSGDGDLPPSLSTGL